MGRPAYKKLKKEWENRPYSIEEMIFYDDLFDGDYRPIREPLIMQITTYSGNYKMLWELAKPSIWQASTCALGEFPCCQVYKSDFCTLDSGAALGYHIREGKPKALRI